MLIRKVNVAGKQRRVVGISARAIDHDVLAPIIKSVPVRIGETIRDIDVAFLRAWLVAEYAGVGQSLRRAVGRLDL